MFQGADSLGTHSLSIGRLYGAECDRLRRIARRLSGDATTAEDLVQQAFVNLLRHDVPVSQAYVTTAVRNLTLNYLRDAKRRAEVMLSDDRMSRIADQAASPEATAIHRNEVRRLLTAINALPPRRRQSFVLNKLAGLTYNEIALRMGVSRNTVISQIVQAMADLDRMLR